MLGNAFDTFDQVVDRITEELGDMLKEKNRSYGDAVANPVNVFSKLSIKDKLAVRIDDKLARLKNGHEYPGDDTIKDLAGYLILWLVTEERIRNGKNK